MQSLEEFMDQYIEAHGERMKNNLMKNGLTTPDRADELIWQAGVKAFEAVELESRRDSIGFGSW